MKERKVLEEISIIDFYKNIIYVLFYIYFFIKDIRHRIATKYDFMVFGFIGIVLLVIEFDFIDLKKIVSIIYSIGFGILILLFSYLSKESIGIGDSLFFIISGTYLNLNDNVALFLSGLFTATIYGGYRFLRYKGKSYKSYAEVNVPFIPCLLPMIIWRVICILSRHPYVWG